MSQNFRRLSEVGIVEEPTDEAKVLIEQNGSIKRTSRNNFGAKPDWDQNDENAADFIRNRPFYDDSFPRIFYEKGLKISEASEGDQWYEKQIYMDYPLIPGDEYAICLNGHSWCSGLALQDDNEPNYIFFRFSAANDFVVEFNLDNWEHYIYTNAPGIYDIEIYWMNDDNVQKMWGGFLPEGMGGYISDLWTEETDEITINGRTDDFGSIKVADELDFNIERVQTMTRYANDGIDFHNIFVRPERWTDHNQIIYLVSYTNASFEQPWALYIGNQEAADYFWHLQGDSNVENPYTPGLYLWVDYTNSDVSISYSFVYEAEEIVKIDKKFLPDDLGNIAQVQSDWSQNDESRNDFVKNRTHYIKGATTISWDGNTEGLESWTLLIPDFPESQQPQYFRIGTAEQAQSLSNDQLRAAVIEDYVDGALKNADSSEMFGIYTSDCAIIGDSGILVTRKNGCVINSIALPDPGIWFGYSTDPNAYPTKLTYPTNTKTLPDVYLSENIARVEDNPLSLQKGALLYETEIETMADGNQDEWVSASLDSGDFYLEPNKNYIVEINGESSIQKIKTLLGPAARGASQNYMGNIYGYLDYLFREQYGPAAALVKTFLLLNNIDTKEDFLIMLNGNYLVGIATKFPKKLSLKIYEDLKNQTISEFSLPEHIRKIGDIFQHGAFLELNPANYEESVQLSTDVMLIKFTSQVIYPENLVGKYLYIPISRALQDNEDYELSQSFPAIKITQNDLSIQTGYYTLMQGLIFVTDEEASVTIAELGIENMVLSQGVWSIWAGEGEEGVILKIGYSDVISDLAIPDTCIRYGNLFWKDIVNKPFYKEQSEEEITVTFDGVLEGKEVNGNENEPFRLVKVSEETPKPEQFYSKQFEQATGPESGVLPTIYSHSSLPNNSDKGYIIGTLQTTNEPFFVVITEPINLSFDEINYYDYSPGIWFSYMNENSYVREATYAKELIIHTLEEDYIPDTIARVSDLEAVTSPKTEFILNSSTEGSTKQFKITVDDNGVISATEIIQE